MRLSPHLTSPSPPAAVPPDWDSDSLLKSGEASRLFALRSVDDLWKSLLPLLRKERGTAAAGGGGEVNSVTK